MGASFATQAGHRCGRLSPDTNIDKFKQQKKTRHTAGLFFRLIIKFELGSYL